MRPLDPLAAISPIAKLLKGAPAPEARAELARLEALPLEGAAAAARIFAEGALALRDGALDAAHARLSAADAALLACGEIEASQLARCEAWLAAIRRGPRAVYAEAIEALTALAKTAGGEPDAIDGEGATSGAGACQSDRVVVVATHYKGTAERFAGDPTGTQRTLLAAFERSEPFLEERAQILNSLGTLYVVLGAFGAAEAMLEHAAELHHQSGDAIGEAISYGQLGSAALARGELDRARRYLQKQEWFAGRVGDAFGRARALTFLADLAIEVGRPDDAVTLAMQAREVASSVSPPLAMWVAYASRAIGRAKVDLEDEGARAELDRALAEFAKIGNQLGDALARWDLAHLEAKSALAARAGGAPRGEPGQAARDVWFSAAWAFGSLGLTSRVAQLLADQRAHALLAGEPGGGADEDVIAATAQGFPHLGVAQELALVYSGPERLAAIASRRTAAQRNLGRLAALTIASPGLLIAIVAGGAIGGGAPAIPPQRAAAAVIAELPGAAVWVWHATTSTAEVARDLSALRAALGEDTRAVLVAAPAGRVSSIPFAGEAGARLEGVSVAPLVAAAVALSPGSLWIARGVPWTADADGLARLSGYVGVHE
jgi:tetratricopeptide (TPR) repeat protein